MKLRVIDRTINITSGVLGEFDGYVKTVNEASYKNYKKPNIKQIQRAIEQRLYVAMLYGNADDPKVKRGIRLIEPFSVGLGYLRPDGKITNPKEVYIRAFIVFDSNQDPYTDGKFTGKWTSVSKTGTDNIPAWRMFKGSSIIDWMSFQRKFSRYRTGYNPDDSHMANILSALDWTDFPYGEALV